MKAIIFTEPKQTRLVTDRPLPQIRNNTLLVKVAAVALNPTDWKHVSFGMAKEGCVLGVDYAGVVEQSNSPGWTKGDRICGFAHGGNSCNPEDGTFAEYIVAPLSTAIKIPPGVSFEAASTLGCGITTVGQGLFESDYGLGLNPPSNPITTQAPVLIYGGSSATGSLGIQFAKE
jgi:NADPH:quinone reductase-like Zn-dependent oxidoreductase